MEADWARREGPHSPLVRSPCGRAEGHRRRNGQHPTVIAANELPVALVHYPVMPVAEQDQVVEIARAAMNPVHYMMSVTAHRLVHLCARRSARN